jgi:DNA repair protein SbcD/Mre11
MAVPPKKLTYSPSFSYPRHIPVKERWYSESMLLQHPVGNRHKGGTTVPIRIFHTADLHLDMKFAQYGDVRYELRKARYDTLERMVFLANEERCDLMVIAGDLFDRPSLAREAVTRAAAILRGFRGSLVAVLPGNHDFTSPGSSELWKCFQQSASRKMLILDKPRIYHLKNHSIDAAIYPAPCSAKHTEYSSIQWIRESEKSSSTMYHIGIAHGSMNGFSPDFNERCYPMNEEELLNSGMDVWLLGHTHFQYPFPGASSSKRIFYPGIPEPRGFECTQEGKAWIIHIDESGDIHETSVPTGKYKFIDDKADLNLLGLDGLRRKYSSTGLKRVLLRLKVTGSLSPIEFEHLQKVKEEMKQSTFFLQWDHSALSVELTMEEIDRRFTRASFPHRLLSALALDNDRQSLQIAYELMGGMKK